MSYLRWTLLSRSFLILSCIFSGPIAFAGPMGSWVNGDPANTLSSNHLLGAATLLQNGKVLAAGGLNATGLATTIAELYNPTTSTWSVTGPLNTARWSLDAVTLDNGKALFAGGAANFSAASALATAEVYDPTSGTFSYTANNLSVGRQSYGISRLNDGRILIAGGNTSSNNLGGTGTTAVDIYDPLTNSFSAAASMNGGRSLQAQLTLQDGRVVVIGGAQTNAEIYDPTLNSWTSSLGNLPTTLKDMKAFELYNGKIFIAGGQNTVDGVTTDATWFFDPSTMLFSSGPSMAGFNYDSSVGVQVGISDYSAFDLFAHSSTMRGRYILFAGGEHDPLLGPDVELDSSSIYDAVENKFYDLGPMPFIHDDHTESALMVNASGNPELLLFGGNTDPFLGTSRFEFDIASVPEPSAIFIFAAGLPWLLMAGRRYRTSGVQVN